MASIPVIRHIETVLPCSVCGSKARRQHPAGSTQAPRAGLDDRKRTIETPLSETIQIMRGFSVETWVKFNNSSDAILFCTVKLRPEDTASGQRGALLLVFDSFFSLAIILFATPGQAAAEIVLQSKKPVALDAWVHVARSSRQTVAPVENELQAADPLDLPVPFTIDSKPWAWLASPAILAEPAPT